MSAPARPVIRPWTSDEDEFLTNAVTLYGEQPESWKTIALHVPSRTNKACRKRWLHSLSPSVKKSAWTEDEDRLLLALHQQHPSKWSIIAKRIAGRTDDACSKRYREALDPRLKKDAWTDEEDGLLRVAYSRLGGKWGQIGKELKRSGLSCRNRWRTLQRKQMQNTPLSSDPPPCTETHSLHNLSSPEPAVGESLVRPLLSTPPRGPSPNIQDTLSNTLSYVRPQLSLLMHNPAFGTAQHEPNPQQHSAPDPIMPGLYYSSTAQPFLSPRSSTPIPFSGVEMQHSNDNLSDERSAATESAVMTPRQPIRASREGLPSTFLTVDDSGSNPAYYRRHDYIRSTVRRKRKNPAQPRLSSTLPVSTDWSLRAYACGHPVCWPDGSDSGLHLYSTSQELSEHHKISHPGPSCAKPFRCGLLGCGKWWKSLNGLQYHLQISKAHFRVAIKTQKDLSTAATAAPISQPADDTRNTSPIYCCPHPGCRNEYRQLAGLNYHTKNHIHPDQEPAQIPILPPALARKIAQSRSQ